jgi:uncharacterized protein
VLKVVIDANVFISALLNPGKPRDVFLALKQDAFRVFYPPQLIKELAKAPSSPKLAGRITVEDVVSLVRLVEHKATMIMVTNPPSISRDIDDNAYLACAANADCDYLVTGDKDLLDLVEHGRTKIVNPAEFLQVLAEPRIE